MNSTLTEDIAGKVAVVVGATGGMGRAIATKLCAAGCRLALIDISQTALDEFNRGLEGNAKNICLAVDIADRPQVDKAAAEIEKHFGKINILVNAAGTNSKERTLANITEEQWQLVMGVNITGAFHCVQAFLDLMKKDGGAIVVNIASTAAKVTSPGAGTHYCAAKRALLSLTESINIEQGKFGVHACAINPGEVDTPLIKKRPEMPSPERRAAMLRPEDIAETVFYVVTRPARVTISELTIWPTQQVAGIFTV